ncbi:hypothetical protein H8356DRAFT_1345861 [Neocallimastix lanati (nom. inval.)]|nr:hypothetical protein H8356DRAFT_1345861 [Neocallimastix sp. JGI-2020a]
MIKAVHYVNLRKTNKTDQNGIYSVTNYFHPINMRNPIQNNFKYYILNIPGKYKRMIIPRVIQIDDIYPSSSFMAKTTKQKYIKGIIIENDRYLHKLRWYNITLQKKDVLDTSNINVNQFIHYRIARFKGKMSEYVKYMKNMKNTHLILNNKC